MLPLVICVFLAAQPIVQLILGDKFAQAAPLLQLLSLLWGVTFFSVLCNKVLNASNHQTLAAIAVAICLALNLLLDFILIPLFGYMGAAVATLAAEGVLLLVAFRFVSTHVCGVTLRRVVPKPLAAALTAMLSGPSAYGSQPCQPSLALTGATSGRRPTAWDAGGLRTDFPWVWGQEQILPKIQFFVADKGLLACSMRSSVRLAGRGDRTEDPTKPNRA